MMYFPEDMTFAYFLFDTYPGYFLQALPVALLTGGIFIYRRRKRISGESWGRILLASLFPCYLAGLCCLTLLFDILGIVYYRILYHMPSGRTVRWFAGVFDFELSFFQTWNGENMANLLMFLPFGILYPLFDRKAGWRKTVLTGICTVGIIELLQPVFGRSFDMNDIVLNSGGVLLSATMFFTGKKVCEK